MAMLLLNPALLNICWIFLLMIFLIGQPLNLAKYISCNKEKCYEIDYHEYATDQNLLTSSFFTATSFIIVASNSLNSVRDLMGHSLGLEGASRASNVAMLLET